MGRATLQSIVNIGFITHGIYCKCYALHIIWIGLYDINLGTLSIGDAFNVNCDAMYVITGFYG